MSKRRRPTSSSPSDCSGGVFDWDTALRHLDELNARAEVPTLWDKPAEAQALMRERDRLASQVEAVRSMERGLADAVEFAEMADAEGDEASLEDARAQVAYGQHSQVGKILEIHQELPGRIHIVLIRQQVGF